MMLLFHHFEAVVQDIVFLFVFIYFQMLLLGRQAKLLGCVMYKSLQHVGFHSDINTQEYWNTSKINIPLSSLLGPTHQVLR